LDIFVADNEDEFEGEITKWQKVMIHGDPEGLRSLAKLLMKMADLDQEKRTDLPTGAREHYHLRPGWELSKSSVDTIVGRLDAKGTGRFTITTLQKTTGKNSMNPKVDFYFNKAKKWQQEVEKLRLIALDCGLSEELKWGCPCYTWQNNNIVLIHDFKDYCAFLFFKGVLLSDTHHLLIQQTENVQVARQIRFTNLMEIVEQEATLKAYIFEAIEVEKAGLKAELKKTTEFTMPDEFQHKLDAIPALKAAFEALTPGRQRGYLLHFAAAKQAKTREARVEKYIPQILNGKGLDD
jgi:uncharacterized protein YdeI (YjbR/CyaY-like superfamily)